MNNYMHETGILRVVDNSTCEILPDPYNGINSVIRGTAGEACSVVQFSCINGSSLVGSPLLTCLPDGQYDNPVPSCSGKTTYILVHAKAGACRRVLQLPQY